MRWYFLADVGPEAFGVDDDDVCGTGTSKPLLSKLYSIVLMFACSSAGQDRPVEKVAVSQTAEHFCNSARGRARAQLCVPRKAGVIFMKIDATKQQSCFSSCDVSAYHQTNQPREVLPAVIARKSCSESFLVKIFDVAFQHHQLPLSILIVVLGFDKRSAGNFGGGYYLAFTPSSRYCYAFLKMLLSGRRKGSVEVDF